MVSTRSLISASSCFLNNCLMIVSSAPIKIGITITFMFHSFFFILEESLVNYHSFRFLSVLPFCQSERESPIFGRFSFFFFLFTVIRPICLTNIRKFVCITKSKIIFLPPISEDLFWVVYIPFVRMVKFKFLVHFPVVNFPQSAVSCLIFFLRWFTAFSYYVLFLSPHHLHLIFCCVLFILILL